MTAQSTFSNICSLVLAQKMDSKMFWVFGIVLFVATSCLCTPLPDSAGIADPLPNGVAPGGIPYGSVSGQLSLYFGDYPPIFVGTNKVSENEIQLI